MSPSSRRSPSGPGCGHHRRLGPCRALSAVRSLAPKAMSRPTPARPRPTGPARCPAGEGGAWCVVPRPRWKETSKDGIRCEEDSDEADTTTASRTCRAGRATRTRGSRLGSAAVPAGRVNVSPSTWSHPYRRGGRSGSVGLGTDVGRLWRGAVGSGGDHARCYHVDDLLDPLAARSGAHSALTTSRVSSLAQPANPPGAR